MIGHYYFGRTNGAKHNGIITAAYAIGPKEASEETPAIPEGMIRIAFAYCSPLDLFSKKIGRKLSAQRLRWGKVRNKQSGTHREAAWDVEFTGKSIVDVVELWNHLKGYYKPQWLRDVRLVIPPEKRAVTLEKEDDQ